MFKSKEEFAIAMLQGRKFKFEDEEHALTFTKNYTNSGTSGLFLIHTSMLNFHTLSCEDLDMYFDKVTEIIEPAPWYENIPECGILVKSFSFGRIMLVYPSTEPDEYGEAEPLTPEEAMNLVYQAEEETPKLEDKWLCWFWDGAGYYARGVGFYDDMNKCSFTPDGKRGGFDGISYEPIPHSQWPVWAVEAHKTLED